MNSRLYIMAAQISDFIPQDILIFGATGLIGKHITDALLAAKSNFRDIGIFTSASSVERKAKVFDAFKAQGAEILIGDIGSEQDVLKAYKGKTSRGIRRLNSNLL